MIPIDNEYNIYQLLMIYYILNRKILNSCIRSYEVHKLLYIFIMKVIN